MTKHNTRRINTTNWPWDQTFNTFNVGFDDILNKMVHLHPKTNQGFPPYNIRRVDETRYMIDVAVTGLTAEDIEVVVEDGELIIRSVWDEKEPLEGTYLHKGLSFSKFTRRYHLADNVEVVQSTLKNGLLTIELEKQIPEEQKPKRIPISVVE